MFDQAILSWLWSLLTQWPTLILIGLTTIYVYQTWNFDYWKKRGVAGPKPLPVFGTVYPIFTRPVVELEMENQQKYGLVYGGFDGRIPNITIGEPELLRDILVKDFQYFVNRREQSSHDDIMQKIMLTLNDEEWKRVRAICTPAFTSGKLRRMFGMINECVDDLLGYMDHCVKEGEMELPEGKLIVGGVPPGRVDLKSAYGCYTMDVIARCAFATDTRSHRTLYPDHKESKDYDQGQEFVKAAFRFFDFKIRRILPLFFLPKWLCKWMKYTVINPDAIEFLQKATRVIVHRRKQMTSEQRIHDFLQLMIEAEKASNSGEQAKQDDEELDQNEMDRVEDARQVNDDAEARAVYDRTINQVRLTKAKLDEDEIVAQAALFLVAGYETTGSLLTYTTYALTLHPEMQQRLYEEIISSPLMKDEDGRDIDYEQLRKLPYLDAVISESLRLYTPVMRMDRVAKEDYKLGNTGIVIEKGTIVGLPFYAIHHDPRFWPEPYKFDPERFMGANREKIVPYSYIPFGAGPRNCLGMRFALLEAKLALVRVLLKFQFEQAPETPIPLEYKLLSNLLQAKNTTVAISYRN